MAAVLDFTVPLFISYSEFISTAVLILCFILGSLYVCTHWHYLGRGDLDPNIIQMMRFNDRTDFLDQYSDSLTYAYEEDPPSYTESCALLYQDIDQGILMIE